MFERLGHLVVRRRRAPPVLFVLGLIVAGVVGSGVFSRLQGAGFDDPGSDSAKAAQHLRDDFGVADPVAAIAVVTPHGLDADAAAGTALVPRPPAAARAPTRPRGRRSPSACGPSPASPRSSRTGRRGGRRRSPVRTGAPPRSSC